MKNASPLEDGAEALTEFDIKMRLGAPHKIDRCADRCSLHPPQAAVTYVDRQRKAWFCGYFNLIFICG